MEENKNLVTEVTENVEQTTEETPKMFTQEEVNEMMGKRTSRLETRIRKEYERKYGDLENVLKAGLDNESASVEELTDTFASFYESKGKKINRNKARDYAPKDLEILARADAEDIIGMGYEEVVEEVDRLADIGADNMTEREKAVFRVLAEHRSKTEKRKELSEIGVEEDVYNSAEFQDFAKMFNPNTPIKDVWNIFSKSQPKKEIKTAGSMKNTTATDEGIKEFYTPEEAKRFTVEDFDRNPSLLARIEESMKRWRK